MDVIDTAIHQTAHESPSMDAKELAQKMGKRYQVFINKVNPNCESHQLTVHEAVAMMLNTGNTQIFDAIAIELRKAGIVGGGDKLKIVDAVMSMVAEGGDVVRAVHGAMADRVITAREKSGILKEISENRAALDALEDAVNREGRGSGVSE